MTLIISSAEGSAELENQRRNINRACLNKLEKREPQHTINFSEPQVLEAELMATAEEDKQDKKREDIILKRSTRDRLLTIRALESLTNKFLLPQKKGRSKDTFPLKDSLDKTWNAAGLATEV